MIFEAKDTVTTEYILDYIGVCLVLSFVSFPFSLLAKHRAARGDA